MIVNPPKRLAGRKRHIRRGGVSSVSGVLTDMLSITYDCKSAETLDNFLN